MRSALLLACAMLVGSAVIGDAATIRKIYVELQNFRIPVVEKSGRTVDATVIPYLQVKKLTQVKHVCKWLPKIRDAITSNLNERPMKKGKKGLNLEKMGRRLTKVVNKSMGSKTVIAVHVGQMRHSGGNWVPPPYSDHALQC